MPKPILIQVSNEQQALPVDAERLQAAVGSILSDAGIGRAEVSLAIVDDPTIHRLNREFLAHDYDTDVLSFLLEREDDYLEGEIVASADTAIRSAAEFGWLPADELLLYIIHGALHLVGHDDQDPASLALMRASEEKHLAAFGLKPRYA